MDNVKQYLLSVISAALICSIANSLLQKKGTYQTILKLICGIFLALTVIAPITNIKLADFSNYSNMLSVDALAVVNAGTDAAKSEIEQIIKQKTEAYILEKAAILGTNIMVDVTLNEDTPPVPSRVTITGNISPYAKHTLQQYITNDLAIAEENQIWM